MTEKQVLPDSRIIASLSNDYRYNVDLLTLLPVGADANASVFRAKLHDGSRRFVKLKRGHDHGVGAAVSRLLFDSGIEQVLSPILTVHGHPVQEVGDFTLIVYPYIDGEDGFTRALGDNHWVALGKTLEKVHAFKLPEFMQEQVRRETFSPHWRSAVRSLARLVREEVDGDLSANNLAQLMVDQSANIQRLVDRSEQMANDIGTQIPEFVLCHSDIHGGNVLIDGNDKLYVVDWDEPILAPKERDLMFIGGGVGSVWNKPEEEQLFYKGYGETTVDLRILAYYRHERIIEDLALYGHDLLLTAEGGDDRPVMFSRISEMFEPAGVVEMAFKTDDEYRPF